MERRWGISKRLCICKLGVSQRILNKYYANAKKVGNQDIIHLKVGKRNFRFWCPAVSFTVTITPKVCLQWFLSFRLLPGVLLKAEQQLLLLLRHHGYCRVYEEEMMAHDKMKNIDGVKRELHIKYSKVFLLYSW